MAEWKDSPLSFSSIAYSFFFLVQNAAARLLADLPRYSHISDYMRRELHWLPVADRVQFKIATLVWKATTGTAPDYIAELCLPVGTQTGRRALRSASRNDLMIPSFRTTTCARRDFSVAPFFKPCP